MATSAPALTEEEITVLGKDNYLGALDLLDKYDIPSDDVEDVDEAMAMLWTALGEHQRSQPQCKGAYDDAMQYSQGVLKNILNENKESRKKLLSNLESVMKFIGKLPSQCLKCLDEVCPNHQEKLADIKRQLVNKQDCVLLVVGETSSGKSSILNLLLGHMDNDFLPISHLSSTSVICELKYGKERRMIVHKRDDREPPLVIDLPDDPGKIISDHTHQKGLRDITFENKRVEIFWPLDWLEDGITLVDTPGIGEDKDLTQLVEEAMKRSFGVIYVVNTTNAGGISSDRLDSLLEAHTRAWVQGDAGTFNPSTAIFVCNKWDRLKPEEMDTVRNHVIDELAERNFKKEQVYFLSCKTAMTQLQKGVMSQTSDLKVLMQGIQSLVPAGLKSKLHQQYSYIVKVLDRIQNILSAFNTEYTADKLASIKKAEEQISQLEQDVQKLKTNSRVLLQQKYNYAVEQLKEHFQSPEVIRRLTTWQKKDCPVDRGLIREELKDEMMTFIMERIQQEALSWEKKTHCFANTHKELLSIFQDQYSVIMNKNYQIEVHMFGERVRHAVEQSSEEEFQFSVGGKIAVGLTFPIWIPLGIVIGVFCIPVFLGWFLFEVFGADAMMNNIEKEMSKRTMQVLKKLTSTDLLEKQLVPVQEQLINVMEKVVEEVIDHLNANKVILKKQGLLEMVNVVRMNVDLGALTEKRKLLRNNLEMVHFTSIKVFPISSTDVSIEKMIGEGTFAEVYIGKWNQQIVAVKRVKSPLTEKNVDVIVREEANLCTLRNPHLVAFYGCSCGNTDSGVYIQFVMEYCHTTLSDYIYPESGISEYRCPSKRAKDSQVYHKALRCAADFALQIARGVNAIHQLGHVHRDLKPDNILVTSDNMIKIADLGLAKDVGEVKGTVCGTILYMAPEVMEGEIYSQKADMFGYGMIMWELWYGQCVLTKYKVKNMTEFLSKPYLPRETRPDTSYDQIMRGCWEMNPDDRLSAETCEEKLMQQYFAEESLATRVQKAACVVQ